MSHVIDDAFIILVYEIVQIVIFPISTVILKALRDSLRHGCSDQSGSESYQNVTRSDDSVPRYSAELGQVFSEQYFIG